MLEFKTMYSHFVLEISWNYLQKTFEQWYKIFEGGFLVQHLAKIPSEFVSFQKAAEIEKFYSTLDFPACKRSMDQCVENIKKNAKWREQEIKTIEKWKTCKNIVKILQKNFKKLAKILQKNFKNLQKTCKNIAKKLQK
ncbi:Aminopeptidase N precursor [Reticulomyxa filosa]|uniref:Aminopeptidase N n=1 Tax=Reticulomyxa filosa TaxID=46433 RepID=X6MDM5_RETFI|nr:Aminopeptidase N precursor [Reticulomyxa filosa]|eukprot:ETO11522.1 Aminopeptidase N precursor [Reticulomyxa filosa]